MDIEGKVSGAPEKFEIEGDLVPAALRSGTITAPLTPESVSGAFLMEEAESFGIVDREDLTLYYSGTLPGGMLAFYAREIGGLRLAGSDIRFRIDSAGHIRKISGEIPAVPKEIYAAVSVPILKEYEARDVATAELIATARTPLTPRVQPRLGLKPTPAYVVWWTKSTSFDGRKFIISSIEIDARTGEVIKHSQHEHRH